MIWSWIMGRLPVLILFACAFGGVAWFGHLRYNAGQAEVQARWDGRELAIQREADRAKAAEAALAAARQARKVAEDKRYTDAQTEIERLGGINRTLASGMQDLAAAARRRPLPQPTDIAGCVLELAAERGRADRGRDLLAEGGELLARISRDRAGAASAAVSVCHAWPTFQPEN